MNRKNLLNEKTKREFISYLKEVGGATEATVDSYLRAINRYEEITDFVDFKKFNKNSAIKFKERIRSLKWRGEPISVLTTRTYFIHTFKFFKWLSFELGYKNNINTNDINYLKPSNFEEMQASRPRKKDAPSLQYVVSLCNSIPDENEIDSRDKALISFLFSTPIRVDAIISLPLGCIDEESLVVSQDPLKNVRTKFSKYITSVVFPFDDYLVNNIKVWIKHLKKKGFTAVDPLFPCGKSEFEKNIMAFKKANKVSSNYWSNSNSVRKLIEKRAEAAGLPYYSPHQFRDGTLKHSLPYVEDGIQMKAVSQSFGHEHIATTMMNYGNLDESDLVKTIKEMNFNTRPVSNNEMLNEIRKLISKRKK